MASYRQAIEYACVKVGVPVWMPNQLRHTQATNIRREFGAEHAQVHLGHSELNTTQIYAEKDERTAIEIAERMG